MAESSRKRAKRAATLADVGREAGVSAMAASAVLNRTKTSARISEETRGRIRAAAAKLNYRPNVAARALVNRRMNTIGVAHVVHGGELNLYFLEVFNGIIEGAAKAAQNTTVFTLHDWASAAENIERSCDGRIDGMIIVAPVLTEECVKKLPHHAPYVTLHANNYMPGVLNIESADRDGARQVVEHMVRLGHRRIMHISGPRGLIGAERRIEGYQSALAAAGLEAPPELLLASPYTNFGGRDVMFEWLREHEGELMPDAIFCGSDAIAMGCYEALAEAGLRVPDDVSVAGFDDTLMARSMVPQLTTVRQPLRAMGIKAVEVLLDRIAHYRDEKAEAEFPPLVYSTKLVPRASVAAPGGDLLVPSIPSAAAI